MRRRILAFIGFAVALCMFNAQPARAQWGWTFYSVGEYDTNEVALLLAGVSLSPQRAGWVPIVGVQAYWLRFPFGPGSESTIAIQPSIGLANNFSTGSFQVRVGYNIADEDLSGVGTGVTADVGDGVVNTVQLDYWGTGKLGAQGIASYNYGSENLWTRGRLTTKVANWGSDGQIRLGGEIAYLNSNDFTSVQPGLVVGLHRGPRTIINLGVGQKFNEGDDATYFKAELVLTPRR
jgi:hypothetical protein